MTRISQCISFEIGETDWTAIELVAQLVDKYPEVLLGHIENSFANLTSDQDLNQQLLDIYDHFKALANIHIVADAYEITKLPRIELFTRRPREDKLLIQGLKSISRDSKIVDRDIHIYESLIL